MNPAFRECLKKRKIIVFPRARNLVQKELATAAQDLAEARDRFEHGRYKYATINAYYAVFHAARALIYAKGYRERSHFCLVVAFKTLFVDSRLLSARYARIIQNTMILREEADYSGTFSEEGAAISILNAEEFIKAARRFLIPTTS